MKVRKKYSLNQGFPKWAMTDTEGATSSKGYEGVMNSKGAIRRTMRSDFLKITLDILKMQMNNKKKGS